MKFLAWIINRTAMWLFLQVLRTSLSLSMLRVVLDRSENQVISADERKLRFPLNSYNLKKLTSDELTYGAPFGMC